jgi:tetratricopeptide (TPR) repeat protein
MTLPPPYLPPHAVTRSKCWILVLAVFLCLPCLALAANKKMPALKGAKQKSENDKSGAVPLSSIDVSTTTHPTVQPATPPVPLPTNESVQNVLFKNRAALTLDDTSSTQPTAPGHDIAPSADGKESVADPILLQTFPYHYRNALRFRKLQENARALEELEKALQANPTHLPSRLELGDCLADLNRLSESLAQYQLAAEQHPVEASPWLRMGDLHLKGNAMNRLELARAAFQKAMEIEPNSRSILTKLAVLEREAGNIPGAIQAFQNLLQQDEKNPEAHLALGMILQSTSPQEALQHLRRYLELKEKHSDPQTELLVNKLTKQFEQNKPAKSPKPQK